MPTKTEYREYIASEAWQRRRREFLSQNQICNRCRLHRRLAVIAYDQDLHVHHRSYARVGAERDDDLEPLCKRCHELETFGRSELHQVVGSDADDFYAKLFLDIGPAMVMSLGIPVGQGDTTREYIGGSMELIYHVMCVLFKSLRSSGCPEDAIDDLGLTILLESKQRADEDWSPFDK
jgi:HNH endonuclease